jgi:hypothetical protein
MPIRKEMKGRYPEEWDLISLWVRVMAGWRCEWCNAAQSERHPITGSIVVLTCAHVYDPAPENVTPSNLAALCQRCHLSHDRKQHIATRAANLRRTANTLDIFEPSPAPSL